MGNMLEQMKKKAIRASSATRSSKVIQKISRADIEKLNTSQVNIYFYS